MKHTVNGPVLISLSDLLTNPIQPTVRTDGIALSELRAQITQSNYIRPIDVCKVAHKNVVADGHRRAELAREIGKTHIEAFVHEGIEPETLFMQLNRGVRRISGAEFFNIWALSSDKKNNLERCPKGHAKNIRKIVNWVGPREAVEFADGRTAPGIALTVEKVAKLQGSFDTSGIAPLSPARILRWMHENHEQNNTTRFIAKRINRGTNSANSVRRLLKAIFNNQPCPAAA